MIRFSDVALGHVCFGVRAYINVFSKEAIGGVKDGEIVGEIRFGE